MRHIHDLSLIRSDAGPSIDGIAYPGLPIFVRPASMRIEYLPTEFCIYVAVVRGRSRSQKTWKAIGYTLLSFIRFMEVSQFDWKQPTEEQLGHFRTHLTCNGRVRATIARAMSTICDFYEWAQSSRHVSGLALRREVIVVSNRGMLSHLGRERLSSRPLLIPNVPKRRRYPRYFTRDEQELLFAILCERDQLAMEWALYTGAREFEICALTTDQIPPQSAYRHRRVYALPLRVTKGAVPGDLWVPTWLLKKTYQYIRFYGRRGAVSASQRFGKPTPEHIFLSRRGDVLKPDTLYRSFKAAVERAGLRGTFHHLRHTYAISMLHRLMQSPRFRDSDGHNALLVLRDLMRHGSVVTTEIYLIAWRRYLTDIDAKLFEMPEQYATTA